MKNFIDNYFNMFTESSSTQMEITDLDYLNFFKTATKFKNR